MWCAAHAELIIDENGMTHYEDTSERLYDKSGRLRMTVFTGTGVEEEVTHFENCISWKILQNRWKEFGPWMMKAIINHTDADANSIPWEWNFECDIPVAEGTFNFDDTGRIVHAVIGPKVYVEDAEPVPKELRFGTLPQTEPGLQ
jgi:hypothetical protein